MTSLWKVRTQIMLNYILAGRYPDNENILINLDHIIKVDTNEQGQTELTDITGAVTLVETPVDAIYSTIYLMQTALYNQGGMNK